MTDLTNVTTEELALEINRRRKEELDIFARLAPTLSGAALIKTVAREDCDFYRINEYAPPEDHCRGCIAEAELHRRELEKERRKREMPGMRPDNYTSVRSGTAADLKQGDVLERQPRPGVEDVEYVVVLSCATSKDGGKWRRVEFRRTNDEEHGIVLAAEYRRNDRIQAIWRKL